MLRLVASYCRTTDEKDSRHSLVSVGFWHGHYYYYRTLTSYYYLLRVVPGSMHFSNSSSGTSRLTILPDLLLASSTLLL